MSVIRSELLGGASGQADGAFSIDRSLRFNSADSPYLSRTPGSAGNRKTFTFSCWLKRSELKASTFIHFLGWNHSQYNVIQGWIWR